MKSITPALIGAPLIALTCLVCAGRAQASVQTLTQTRQFNLGDNLQLHGIGLPDFPAPATGWKETPSMLFDNFDASKGTLIGARWELDMTYAISLLSSVYSMSTNPNEQVSGIASVGMNISSTALGGTGGARFQGHGEGYGECSTTLAQGLCYANALVEGSVHQVIDAVDLDFFINTWISARVDMSDELWNFQTQGSIDMYSNASYLAFGPNGTKGLVHLVYEYEDGNDGPGAVPEPGSFALAGLGLAAIWRSRGRKSRAQQGSRS